MKSVGGNMSELRASPEELANAGKGVRDNADRLQDRVNALTDRVESLLGGGWQGQAAEAFRRDWQTWLDGARNVIGGLDTMSELLTTSGQAYSGQDTANAANMRATGSSLNL